MNYTEKLGDLFKETKDGIVYAHCIASDYGLGAGIAVIFNKKYNMRERLKEIGSHVFPDCIKIDNVYNLVTKERSSGKPTYGNLQTSLIMMKTLIVKDGVKDLAIPKIGCGLDGLSWNRVSTMIKTIFSDLDINITVCYIE